MMKWSGETNNSIESKQALFEIMNETTISFILLNKIESDVVDNHSLPQIIEASKGRCRILIWSAS